MKRAAAQTPARVTSWAERSLPAAEERPELGRNLTYGLLDRLGRAIVTGEFDSTPFPIEAELVRRYGVSLSVTREAVKMLSAKGLLTARPRQGTSVQPISSWNLYDADVLRWLLDRQFSMELLRHFNQLRIAIEPEAAALAACFAQAEDIGRIERALERVKAARDGLNDPLQAKIAFHAAILQASRNPFYAQFGDVVGAALRTSLRFPREASRSIAGLQQHGAVQDAIRMGVPDEARAAMRRLIAGVPPERGSDHP